MRLRVLFARTGLVIGAAVLGGCSVSGPAFERMQVPAGKSVVYAYRPKSFFGAALRPDVTCGPESASLGPGGYHPFVIDPGRAICSARTEAKSEVELEAAEGGEQFVREKIGWGFFVGRPHLYLEEEGEALPELQKCKKQ